MSESLFEAPVPASAGAGAPALTVRVYGTPAGQGQISCFGKGRAIHTNEKRLKPWREAVAKAALEAAGTHRIVKSGQKPPTCSVCGLLTKRHGLLAGPLRVTITVTMESSAAVAKRGDVWPDNMRTTDVDHHARAALDALSLASVWSDDAQVADLHVVKAYPTSPHPDALAEPGAVIRIWRLT